MTTHAFRVDLTNPGHFFACCGLLELANCLDEGAEGRFTANGFELTLGREGFDPLSELLACPVKADLEAGPTQSQDEADDKSPALLLSGRFEFRLDWWKQDSAVQAGFKTWGGGQTVMGFFEGMRGHVKASVAPASDCLVNSMALDTPKPFYFDCRLSTLTTIDMGFSAEGLTTTYSPAAELLTLVGLQRFRPQTITKRETYAYSIWGERLPAALAAAVAHGLLPGLTDERYQFPLVVRTGGRYKAFGPARITRSDNA